MFMLKFICLNCGFKLKQNKMQSPAMASLEHFLENYLK